jgi:glutamate synthase (NADPH/NADH) small chain
MMDDLYGFLRHPRREPVKQPPRERIRHWREYIRIFPIHQAAVQANRCIDCGTPWCHVHCPVHNLIPDWNLLVTDGQWQRAYRQLDSTNNFPELTGRLCPAPCEDACTLRLSGSPVTIKSIEQAISERAWQRGWVTPRRAAQTHTERIAIIGSGPAGLACAQQLVRAGYPVEVFEKADRIGGLLRYGIPDFRLEKWILDRRLKQLAAEGVRFRTGVHIESREDFECLQRSADAIVLACGCEQPRNVLAPGREVKGIHFAMEYLAQQNHRTAGDVIEAEAAILATGKDVVVIGGGDTGSDCIGTAVRQQASRVVQVQYHAQPPPCNDVLQYWPEPVPVLHTTDHDAEGCRRIWGWDTIGFERDAGGVSGIRLQKLDWRKRADGSWKKRRCPDHFLELPAQLVLIAIGYAHPVPDGLLANTGLALDKSGVVMANDQDYKTDTPGVFTCGDMRRGQSLIVWAIREGRQCAHAVDEWLSGHSDLPTV